MRVIRRRLAGKQGPARIKELRAILADLPNYKNGPYADLRKWVAAQIDETRQRERVAQRDSIGIPKQGAAQIAVVGPPNAGKSSLLQAMSRAHIKTGDYAFTTTRPVAALTRVCDVLLQLVEIPGLLSGAAEDRGGGRALLSVLRTADAMVLCHPVTEPVDSFLAIWDELIAAGIDLPYLVAATRADEADPTEVIKSLRQRAANVGVIAVSVLDDLALGEFAEAVWRLTGLIRIYPRRGESRDDVPIALRPPVHVRDVADAIHHDLARRCRGARLWTGAYPGQVVGPAHLLRDGDEVEILERG